MWLGIVRVLVWNLVMLSSDEQGVRESSLGELGRMDLVARSVVPKRAKAHREGLFRQASVLMGD